MIERIILPKRKPIGCIICLPGRGMSGCKIADTYRKFSGLKSTLFVGLTPREGQWYPMPNGIKNQAAAVAGLPIAMQKVEAVTARILKSFRIRRDAVALVGYSAGAVTALHTAIFSKFGYAAAVAHSGAVLDPLCLSYCSKHNLQVMMTHCKDDNCFFWEERYVPTKNALKENGYNAAFIEHETGGHFMMTSDIIMAGMFLAPLLGYPPNWSRKCCIS